MTKAILTDIEGTTTSISFVHRTLFPYSREAMPLFVGEKFEDPTVREILDSAAAVEGLSDYSAKEITQLLMRWIDEDRKETPLKALQGLIWKSGYQHGSLKGHLYKDAKEWLEKWYARGLTLAVFSSGSIEAQRLLFGHSEYGDLTPLFSHHFDTTTGPKKVKSSYEAIAKSMSLSPEDILFLSDVVEELDAAKEAGMLTCHIVRPEDETTGSENHKNCPDFESVENWM